MELKEAIEFYNLHRKDEIIEKYHESIRLINGEIDKFKVPNVFYKSTRDYNYYIQLPCEEYVFTENGVELRKRGYDGMALNKKGNSGLRLCQALCNRSFEYIKESLDIYIEEQLAKENT